MCLSVVVSDLSEIYKHNSQFRSMDQPAPKYVRHMGPIFKVASFVLFLEKMLLYDLMLLTSHCDPISICGTGSIHSDRGH